MEMAGNDVLEWRAYVVGSKEKSRRTSKDMGSQNEGEGFSGVGEDVEGQWIWVL